MDIEAIYWVEASGDYARIHAGKHAYLVSQRMHALERLLEAREFVRVHRSLIVNVKRVRELHREPDGGGTLVLTDGVRLRVARGAGSRCSGRSRWRSSGDPAVDRRCFVEASLCVRMVADVLRSSWPTFARSSTNNVVAVSTRAREDLGATMSSRHARRPAGLLLLA